MTAYTLLPTCVILPNFVALGQTVSAYLRKPPEILTLASGPSRSLKVTGTDADQSVTYDFLLVLHSNYGPISYRFRDEKR